MTDLPRGNPDDGVAGQGERRAGTIAGASAHAQTGEGEVLVKGAGDADQSF
ncbi:MAG: hypothetical protein WDN76_10565 [Alphaproteobacteria bacterium]